MAFSLKSITRLTAAAGLLTLVPALVPASNNGLASTLGIKPAAAATYPSEWGISNAEVAHWVEAHREGWVFRLYGNEAREQADLVYSLLNKLASGGTLTEAEVSQVNFALLDKTNGHDLPWSKKWAKIARLLKATHVPAAPSQSTLEANAEAYAEANAEAYSSSDSSSDSSASIGDLSNDLQAHFNVSPEIANRIANKVITNIHNDIDNSDETDIDNSDDTDVSVNNDTSHRSRDTTFGNVEVSDLVLGSGVCASDLQIGEFRSLITATLGSDSNVFGINVGADVSDDDFAAQVAISTGSADQEGITAQQCMLILSAGLQAQQQGAALLGTVTSVDQLLIQNVGDNTNITVETGGSAAAAGVLNNVVPVQPQRAKQ